MDTNTQTGKQIQKNGNHDQRPQAHIPPLQPTNEGGHDNCPGHQKRTPREADQSRLRSLTVLLLGEKGVC